MKPDPIISNQKTEETTTLAPTTSTLRTKTHWTELQDTLNLINNQISTNDLLMKTAGQPFMPESYLKFQNGDEERKDKFGKSYLRERNFITSARDHDEYLSMLSHFQSSSISNSRILRLVDAMPRRGQGVRGQLKYYFALSRKEDESPRFFEIPKKEKEAARMAIDNWDINKENCVLEDKTRKNVKRILIVAYARTGSSFLGELLSSNPHSSYFFEPLYIYRKMALYPGIFWTKEFYDYCHWILSEIFSCSKTTLKRFAQLTWRTARKVGGVSDQDDILKMLEYNYAKGSNSTEEPRNNVPLVVKVIRLRLESALNWLNEHPDIHVVHLVRDPRGQMHSIERKLTKWSSRYNDPRWHCGNMLQDLEAGKNLSVKRYTIIRYEDLIDNPEETGRNLFSVVNLPFTNDSLSYLKYHMSSELFSTTPTAAPTTTTKISLHRKTKKRKSSSDYNSESYYSTYRNSSFRHDAWKINMAPSVIWRIERVCAKVMKILGYKLFSGTKD